MSQLSLSNDGVTVGISWPFAMWDGQARAIPFRGTLVREVASRTVYVPLCHMSALFDDPDRVMPQQGDAPDSCTARSVEWGSRCLAFVCRAPGANRRCVGYYAVRKGLAWMPKDERGGARAYVGPMEPSSPMLFYAWTCSCGDGTPCASAPACRGFGGLCTEVGAVPLGWTFSTAYAKIARWLKTGGGSLTVDVVPLIRRAGQRLRRAGDLVTIWPPPPASDEQAGLVPVWEK